MSASPQQRLVVPVGTYRIVPARSSVSFTTRHFFGLARVAGGIAVAGGDIHVEEPLERSKVNAQVTAGSFNSGIKLRDWQVRSPLFLHARKHQHLTFRSTRIEQTPGGWVVRGMLTARGVEAPADLTVVATRADASGLVIEARGRVDRYAHRVTFMRGIASRYLDLSVTVVAEMA